MPIKPETLTSFVAALFQAGGTPEGYARMVAESLVRTNQTGHDSHGVVRVSQYLASITAGGIKPDAEPQVAQETGAITIVDGQMGFGQVTADFAMRLTIEKTQEHGIAATGLVNSNHVGRLGEWVEMAAAENMIGLAFCNVYGGRARRVAPFGGTRQLLGTNPFAAAVPVANRPPIVLDFATSVVAEGKVRLARNEGKVVPKSWLLDAEGQPTVNPYALYQGGALRAMGGYKGYGLAVLMELLGGILMGSPGLGLPGLISRNGVLFIVLAIDAFRPIDAFLADVAEFYAYVKAEPSAAGIEKVLLPGDPEQQALEHRRQKIPLDEPTWQLLRHAATELGVAIPA